MVVETVLRRIKFKIEHFTLYFNNVYFVQFLYWQLYWNIRGLLIFSLINIVISVWLKIFLSNLNLGPTLCSVDIYSIVYISIKCSRLLWCPGRPVSTDFSSWSVISRQNQEWTLYSMLIYLCETLLETHPVVV